MNTKRKIQIGLVYSAKVGGTFLPVRIDKSLGHGRYEGDVMTSGATVKFSTDSIKGDGETVEQWQARRTPKERDLTAPEAKATGKRKKSSQAEYAVTALIEPGAKTGKKGQPKADKPAKQRKPGGLDAAVTVLRESGVPMNTADMVARMLEKGLWKTGGKTPAATIYAAIIREIAVKGSESRFRKTERGRFELAK
jgi:hypothetical protein